MRMTLIALAILTQGLSASAFADFYTNEGGSNDGIILTGGFQGSGCDDGGCNTYYVWTGAGDFYEVRTQRPGVDQEDDE